ncbi:MAG: hypothetical protein U0792_14270 [Gemmataceae bacterium]
MLRRGGWRGKLVPKMGQRQESVVVARLPGRSADNQRGCHKASRNRRSFEANVFALRQVDLREIVRCHELQQVLDRSDVERPGRVPFVVGHLATPIQEIPAL